MIGKLAFCVHGTKLFILPRSRPNYLKLTQTSFLVCVIWLFLRCPELLRCSMRAFWITVYILPNKYELEFNKVKVIIATEIREKPVLLELLIKNKHTLRDIWEPAVIGSQTYIMAESIPLIVLALCRVV